MDASVENANRMELISENFTSWKTLVLFLRIPARWFRGGLKKDDMDRKPEGASRDGRISQVESRPMMRADVEVQKVHHFLQPQTVDEVADSPSDNEREAEHESAVLPINPGKPIEHEENNTDGRGNQDIKGKIHSWAVEKTEGHTSVSHMHEVEKSGNDRNGFVDIQRVNNDLLGYLVQ
jgi:hypothetical protein